MKPEKYNQIKSLLIFVSVSIAVAYLVMYGQLLSPNDETGHSIGWFLVSLLWAFINFVNLIRLFVGNRIDRLHLGGLVLILPSAWLAMWFSFLIVFHMKIIEIHPVWDDGSILPELADDGILLVQVAAALAILGVVLLFISIRGGKWGK